MDLENAFDRETDHGRGMDKYDKLLAAALRSIAATYRSARPGRSLVIAARSCRRRPSSRGAPRISNL